MLHWMYSLPPAQAGTPGKSSMYVPWILLSQDHQAWMVPRLLHQPVRIPLRAWLHNNIRKKNQYPKNNYQDNCLPLPTYWKFLSILQATLHGWPRQPRMSSWPFSSWAGIFLPLCSPHLLHPILLQVHLYRLSPRPPRQHHHYFHLRNHHFQYPLNYQSHFLPGYLQNHRLLFLPQYFRSCPPQNLLQCSRSRPPLFLPLYSQNQFPLFRSLWNRLPHLQNRCPLPYLYPLQFHYSRCRPLHLQRLRPPALEPALLYTPYNRFCFHLQQIAHFPPQTHPFRTDCKPCIQQAALPTTFSFVSWPLLSCPSFVSFCSS